MSQQGPYPPGYDPADGPQPPQPPRRPPGEGWAGQQRPPSSGYPTPDYAGPESPSDPHSQYRRPQQPYGGGGGEPGGYGGGFGGPPPPPTSGGGFGAPPYGQPQQPQQSGGFGEPGRYGDPTQYQDPTQYGDPNQYGERSAEAGRFSALRYEEPAGGPPPEAPPKSKRGLIIGVVVATVVVLALIAVGVVYVLSAKSGGNSFAVNSCVRRSGDKAESVNCSTSGSFQIVSKVGSPNQCPDQQQPYVVLQEKGKADQVLCLKPSK